MRLIAIASFLAAMSVAIIAVAQHHTRRVVHHSNDLPLAMRQCTHDADCDLATTRCCPSCGTDTALDFVAIAGRHAEAYRRHTCAGVGVCVRCQDSMEFGVDSACVRGQCEVVVRSAPVVPLVEYPDAAGVTDAGATMCVDSRPRIVAGGIDAPSSLRTCRVSADCTAISADSCPACGVLDAADFVPLARRFVPAWASTHGPSPGATGPACGDCIASVDPSLGISCVRNVCEIVQRDVHCESPDAGTR